MAALNEILDSFVKQSQEILENNLVGLYLHGSAVMGCYNEKKSDIDLLVVVKAAPSNETKRRFMDMVVKLNAFAPPKGIEMSVVKREVCDPFVYPTPFELHFSSAHLARYEADPSKYIEEMKGTDKDLAAHFTIVQHRGRRLCGASIEDVFGPVPKEDYMDSIWYDIGAAETEVLENPTYVVLNLCRALAYTEEERILSKREGGQWALGRVPEGFRPQVEKALEEYASDGAAEWDGTSARAFAAYMLARIRS